MTHALSAAELLRRIVKDEGTQKVASDLGVSQATVSYLQSGKRRPGIDLAAKIERKYGIPAARWSRAAA